MRQLSVICLCTSLIVLAWFPQCAVAAVSLELQLVAPSNLEVFFLTDLNVSGQAPSAIVFHVTVTSDQSYDRCFFTFSMSSWQTEIIQSKSADFNLQMGITQISNLDLTADGSLYQLEDYDVSSEAESIQDKLLQTGYFPSGTYMLSLELHRSYPDSILASDAVSVVLTNPFDIFLISPAGTPASPAPLSTTTPLFTWSSSANQFLLKVCEKTFAGMDPESVMENRPHYETDPAAPQIGQSFLYPASGVRPLEPGHTYYWQVASLVQTSSGPREYPSAIGAFTLVQQQDPESQQILLLLQRILSLNYPSVMSELSGFQPTGGIHLDGAGISVEELEGIARKFERGHYQTTSVRTE